MGFIVPTKKTKKLSYEQMMDAITGRVSVSCVPSKNMVKKASKVQKLNKRIGGNGGKKNKLDDPV